MFQHHEAITQAANISVLWAQSHAPRGSPPQGSGCRRPAGERRAADTGLGPWPRAGSTRDAGQGAVQCLAVCEMGTVMGFLALWLLPPISERATGPGRTFSCCAGTVTGPWHQAMPPNASVLLSTGRRDPAFLSSCSSLPFCSCLPFSYHHRGGAGGRSGAIVF